MTTERCDVLDLGWVKGKQRVGVTAGASAPEVLVEEVVKQLEQWGGAFVEESRGVEENVVFPLPKELQI